MYAIVLGIDASAMDHAVVEHALADHGFNRQQDSVYFGNDAVTAVSCVLAVQDMAQRFPWFAACVRDIRMLRIEEDSDLSVALGNPTHAQVAYG